ncbi:hypothetical protein [Halococcoides cellulosivorans]|uniref:Uncharacterized protein n=1 Tax=Halococcoides cellulosivorans TaxID=1679096 RepID=A0A2R4WXW9_9EURY|nr:hypothetical protein [Halococcoides cellulosivorans]AWB26360.1 hypothetical protein HARCEL1_00810 [Halococcoides cellulosivorans]
MDRRSYLAALGTAAVGSLAGCTGGQVMTVRPARPIHVTRGRGEIVTIPAEGDAISYVARDDQRFAIYFFTSSRDLAAYRAFIDGENPERTPGGDIRIGSHAVPREGGDGFEASTPDRGRVSIDATGETYFVIDHSAYRMETVPPETAGPLSVALDLTVTKSALPV